MILPGLVHQAIYSGYSRIQLSYSQRKWIFKFGFHTFQITLEQVKVVVFMLSSVTAVLAFYGS